MKKAAALLVMLMFAASAFTAAATEETSSYVESEAPTSSAVSSVQPETSSQIDSSSDLVSSNEASSEMSSQPDENQSSQAQTVSREEKPGSQTPAEDADDTTVGESENRGAAILVFCYIVTALIGVCLVGMIIANVYIPVANKKRELENQIVDQRPEGSYDLGEHSPRRKKYNRRPGGKM